MTINASYDEGRGAGRAVHEGVDFESKLTSTTGRPTFATMSGVANGAQLIDLYGETQTITHTVNYGGQVYKFQTFYAHLASPSPLSYEAPVTTSTQIGVTGGTGGTVTYPIHLHFETQAKYTTGSDQRPRRYPPAALFWANPSAPYLWGDNTSFINAMAGDHQNQIKFRFVAMDLGAIASLEQAPTLHYRAGTDAWKTVPMVNTSGKVYTMDMSSLNYPAGNTIYYYISVRGNSFNGTYYTTHRPYLNTTYLTPPDSRPFAFTVK